MTCRELRLYFEDPLRMDPEFNQEAEHLAQCAECARFVEERLELAARLRLIRESLPSPSTALNSTVLTNYRRQIAAGPRAVRSFSKRRAAVVMSWSAAAAALALAVALLLHPARKAENSTAKLETGHPYSLSRPDTPVKAAKHVSSGTAVPSIKTTRSHLARGSRSVLSAMETQSTVAEDFRSLMYCDQFSCGGEMLLIRVQLPSSAAPFGPASTTDNRIIYADVLVGPDGVARGIRVVR